MKAKITSFLEKAATSWPSFLKKEKRCLRLAAIISHPKNEWALRALHGMQTYFLNSNTELTNTPELEVIARSEIDTESALSLHDRQFDGIVTVGIQASLEAKSTLIHHRATDIPLFACGIKDPVESGLVSSLDNHEQNIGIVTGQGHNHKKQAESFLALRPGIKRVALIHYSQPLIQKNIASDIDGMTAAFHSYDIETKVCKVSIQTEIFIKEIERIARWADAICTFRDIQIKNDIEPLIDLCNARNVTIFSSELASVLAGAAVGFGGNGFVYGEKIGVMIEEHFLNKKDLKKLPVALFREPAELKVNNAVIGKQGMLFDRKTYLLISNTELLYKDG